MRLSFAVVSISLVSGYVACGGRVGFHGNVYRMPLAGGNVTHLASCEDTYPEKLSVDSNSVY